MPDADVWLPWHATHPPTAPCATAWVARLSFHQHRLFDPAEGDCHRLSSDPEPKVCAVTWPDRPGAGRRARG